MQVNKKQENITFCAPFDSSGGAHSTSKSTGGSRLMRDETHLDVVVAVVMQIEDAEQLGVGGDVDVFGVDQTVGQQLTSVLLHLNVIEFPVETKCNKISLIVQIYKSLRDFQEERWTAKWQIARSSVEICIIDRLPKDDCLPRKAFHSKST